MRAVGVRDNTPFHQLYFVVLIALAFTALRVFFIYLEPFDLYADEAQYWTWSKDFDWGYYSKPPVIAWLINLTTSVCGDGSFCVRLSAPLLHFFASIFIYLAARRLFDARVGAWSAVTYLTLPGITLSSAVIATDAPLLFFWSAAFYFFVRAIKDWHIKFWIVAGLVAGLGMLSKYSMVLFLPSAMLYLLLSENNRVYLISPQFWIATLIAALVYLPNLIWNANNGFLSYLHAGDNAKIDEFSVHPDKLLEFVGSQFGVFGPVLFFTLLFLCVFTLPKLLRNDSTRMLVAFIAPMFITICVVSFLSRAHANWAAPAYVAGTILVVSYLVNPFRKAFLKFSVLLHLLVAVLFFHLAWLEIEISPKIDPLRRVRGWTSFGNQAAFFHQLFPNAQLFSNERKLVAHLKYHLRDYDGTPAVVYKWNADGNIQDHYDLTADLKEQVGKDFLFISRGSAKEIHIISHYFDSSTSVGEITTPLSPGNSQNYTVYHMRNFHGYDGVK
jgi:hypothetical protein